MAPLCFRGRATADGSEQCDRLPSAGFGGAGVRLMQPHDGVNHALSQCLSR
jgi:hypothetical protein